MIIYLWLNYSSWLPDRSPVIGPGGSRILRYGPRHQLVVVLTVALELKMHMNSKIHWYHAVFKSKFKAAYKRKNEKRIVANYGIMRNKCMYTYRLMITSSFMGEPSGFLRNSGIFLSVSELLILLRGFVAFFFGTFFVAQVSNLLGY